MRRRRQRRWTSSLAACSFAAESKQRVRSTNDPAHGPSSRHDASRGGWLVALGCLVGLAAGLVGVGVRAALLVGPALGIFGALVVISDLRARRIPDRLVGSAALAAVVVAIAVELVDRQRPGLDMVLGSALTALPLLVVHLVSPAGLGFGDVKFAAVVGALLGVASPFLGGLAVGAACTLAIGGIALRAWSGSSIPFGACLAVTAVGSLAADRWLPM